MGNYSFNFKGIILGPKVNTFIRIIQFGWVHKAKENMCETDCYLVPNLWLLPFQKLD